MAKNKFEILKERISYAEAGGTGNMDANILKSNSSQHYGYQQIDKTRIKLFSEYLIFLFKDNNTLLNIVTEFYTSFMEATSTDRAQGTQTWTRIFTEHWQDLLHTLYTYDKIKQKPSLHHLDQVILNNLLGQWQAFESIQELHTPVYSDKDFTYFNYLGHSMPDISDREKMHVPHPDSPTSSIFLDPCTRETLLLDLEAHVKDTLWPLLFDNEEYVPLFDIHKYESFKRTSTVPTEAGTEESVKSLNPNFYKWGRGAEEQGALYIGDILFSVPPVSLRFSTTNQSLVIPTMRTKGDPIMTSNGELSRIDTTLYFTGVDAINNQLRPLNALFQNMPFTTVQNTTIYDSWISRKVIQQDLKPDTDARSRFFPIPIYLENISVTTVPGFPNTMQAHVSFVKFNNLPYGAALKYYKHNDDAIANAKKKSTIGALDSKIIKSDATDKETTLTVLKSNSTVETFSGSNTLNKTDAYNEDVYTFYPQESTPFQNQYKYAFKKGVKDYWPKYVDKDNETLYLTYKAPKTMMSASYAFKSRLDTINRKNSLIKSTLNNINSMSNDAIKELYSVQEFDFKGLLSSLLNSVSFVREYKETKNAFNRAFYDWISELQDNNAFGPYSIDSATLQEAFGVDNVSEILELKSENFVDKDLNITSVGEKLIEFVTVTMVNVIADSSASPEDKQRDLDALFSPLIDQLNLHADNPSGILDTDVTNTPLNYEKVTIGLGIFGEGENEYQDGRIALETLYSENVHSNTPYAFQSVVQSISYSYANTVIPIQMASASSPTYQHMGVSNPTVSITLRTRDEGLNKLITDMRIATQEIGRSVAMGSTSLIGLDSIEIQGSTSTSDKGHLLNALGFSSASIKNIHSKSLESYPGWWEITIDLVSNKQKIRILEKLNAVSTDALDIIPALTQHLFPLYKVNMFPVLSKISNATIANLSNEIGRVGVSKVRLHGEIFLENLLPLEERISNLLKGDITENYFVGVDFNCFIDDQLAVHIVMPGRANIVSNYWEILANLISFIEDTLNDVTRWEQERRLESDSWNEIHPINISLSATLRSHYEDVLNSVIATISFIAKNNPKELEKVGSTQAFYPLLGMPTDLSSPNILLELIILSNQLKTSAYGLIKRADFREYMSELEFSQKLDADSLIEIIKSNLTEVEDWSTSVFRDELYKNIALFYKKVHKYRSSLSPETPDITESFNTLFEAIGKNISPNYPDLSLGNDIIEDIGVRYKSPSFPFVDQDLNAEVIQME
ncbi:MAG: hypothetical protein HN730_11005, partial [Bdellovibrionales bacterium]|nr:hypothetical protein [Bdellovibrionales bacterium]